MVGKRVWFSRELRECVSVFVILIPNEWERKKNMRIGNHGRHFFFCVGEGGGEPPPFYRIINNFLLFYHGQLIRTYIKNTILESSSKRRLVYLRT